METSICPKCGETRGEEMCQGCTFWRSVRDSDPVVISGQAYTIGPEDAPACLRGFGGSRYRIRFHDGREVVTTNLWCRGDVPPGWRQELPDNATFVWEGA